MILLVCFYVMLCILFVCGIKLLIDLINRIFDNWD